MKEYLLLCLLQYLLLLETDIRVFWIAAHCVHYVASRVWSWAHWSEQHWLINWERVHDYSLTDGCGSRTSDFLFTVWMFWTLCICVCIHRHTNVCTPDLVKDDPTSFVTKTSISLKMRERERDEEVAMASTRVDSQSGMVSWHLCHSFDRLA